VRNGARNTSVMRIRERNNRKFLKFERIKNAAEDGWVPLLDSFSDNASCIMHHVSCIMHHASSCMQGKGVKSMIEVPMSGW
jgi:hypothetical protein